MIQIPRQSSWIFAVAFTTLLTVAGCKSGETVVTSSGGKVQGGKLVPLEAYSRAEVQTVQEAAARIAKQKGINPWEVKAEDVQTDSAVKDLGLGDPEHKNTVETDLGMDPEFMSTGANFDGYTKIDFNDAKNPVLNYAVAPNQSTVTNSPESRKFRSFKDAYKDQPILVYELKVTSPGTTQPDSHGKPTQTSQPTVRSISFGPIDKAEADRQVEQVRSQGVKVEIVGTIPAALYSNSRGYVVVAVEGPIKLPHRMTMPQMSYYAVAPDVMDKLALSNVGNAHKLPPQRAIPVAIFEKN